MLFDPVASLAAINNWRLNAAVVKGVETIELAELRVLPALNLLRYLDEALRLARALPSRTLLTCNSNLRTLFARLEKEGGGVMADFEDQIYGEFLSDVGQADRSEREMEDANDIARRIVETAFKSLFQDVVKSPDWGE